MGNIATAMEWGVHAMGLSKANTRLPIMERCIRIMGLHCLLWNTVVPAKMGVGPNTGLSRNSSERNGPNYDRVFCLGEELEGLCSPL